MSRVSLFNYVTYYDYLIGNTYTLMVDQTIKIIEKDRRLLPPFQMRANGLIVDYFSRKSETKGIRTRQYIYIFPPKWY